MKTRRLLLLIACALATACGVARGDILLIEDQCGFGNAASILTAAGHTVTVVNYEYAAGYADLLNGAFLASFDFVVYGERGDGWGSVLPPAVAGSLENYIQSGGHLLVTGYDTLGSPDDPNLAALVRSATYGDWYSYSPNWQTANIDHPILNGPYGDFRDLSFGATGYDDDDLLADTALGAMALAVTAGAGVDRVILTDLPGAGGSVGYWNGGVSGDTTDAQPDFSDGGIPQSIFLNWAAWADGGGSQVIPEPCSLTLLALGGLGLLARRRRKP